jgi:hypothetical protein
MSKYYQQLGKASNAKNKRCRRGNESRNNRFDEPWSQFTPNDTPKRILKFRKLKEKE